MTVKLTSEEMRYITLFEGVTGARVQDCVIDESGKVTFVVKKGDIGLAIGKGGDNIRRARRVLGKRMDIIEYSDDLTEFLKNTLAPAKVKRIELTEHDGRKVAVVTIEKYDRGIAIGARGNKIQNAKKLAHRHYGVHDISLA